MAERPARDGKRARQQIGQADGDSAVECAFAGKACERGRGCGIPQRTRHLEGIAQAQVEALSRDGVDGLRRITDGSDSAVDRDALRMQAEREGMARADLREMAHAIAEGCAQFRKKGVFRQTSATACLIG